MKSKTPAGLGGGSEVPGSDYEPYHNTDWPKPIAMCAACRGYNGNGLPMGIGACGFRAVPAKNGMWRMPQVSYDDLCHRFSPIARETR